MHFKTVLPAALSVSLAAAPVYAAPSVTPMTPQSSVMAQPVLGQKVTDQVVKLLRIGSQRCGQLDAVYQADCLRQVFRETNNEIRRRPDYRAASNELRTMERQLDALVKANIDRSAPTIRVQGKRVRAVKKAIAPQVNATARKVITESATRLLRSSGSAESVAQLTQIAQAIDSTKRILRS